MKKALSIGQRGVDSAGIVWSVLGWWFPSREGFFNVLSLCYEIWGDGGGRKVGG